MNIYEAEIFDSPISRVRIDGTVLYWTGGVVLNHHIMSMYYFGHQWPNIRLDARPHTRGMTVLWNDPESDALCGVRSKEWHEPFTVHATGRVDIYHW